MSMIENVFFSGGFDTTSYILECLLLKKIKVQPIVVQAKYIDGLSTRRSSEYHEEVSRKNFYKKFRERYPKLSNNLLDEIRYENVTLDNDTLNIGKIAFEQGIFNRPITQDLYFHQTAKDNNLDVVVGYQKDDGFSEKDKLFFKDNLNFRIPIIDVSKKELLNTAIKNEYDSFLYETWSCWYPKENNQPCKECTLCKITIVETKLKFPIVNKELI